MASNLQPYAVTSGSLHVKFRNRIKCHWRQLDKAAELLSKVAQHFGVYSLIGVRAHSSQLDVVKFKFAKMTLLAGLLFTCLVMMFVCIVIHFVQLENCGGIFVLN